MPISKFNSVNNKHSTKIYGTPPIYHNTQDIRANRLTVHIDVCCFYTFVCYQLYYQQSFKNTDSLMPTPQIYESEYSNKYLNTAPHLQRPLKQKKSMTNQLPIPSFRH